MPSPPHSHRSKDSAPLDLSALETQIANAEEQRQKAYDLSREMSVSVLQARNAINHGSDDAPSFVAKFDEFLQNDLVKPENHRAPRLANISSRMEDFARVRAFQRFLESADLEPPREEFTDEEYLSSCMGLAQDLQRYGLGRATVRDVDSVQAAANLVGEILDFLMEIDFRNGPLRRKYDGTKYSLKALETLLYELAVTSSSSGEPPEKRAKTEESPSLLQKEELKAIKERMEYRDNLREKLIKLCRDGQKMAKQSIYALQRGDEAKATDLLKTCYSDIQEKLLPIVNEEPPLRGGSFGNVVEEYVEGKLFWAWLYGTDNEGRPSDGKPSGVVLKPDQLEMELKPEEYLGGLCDLTGEIGRYAVQRGTVRDVEGVQLCLKTNSDIQMSLESIGRLPHGIPKKMDHLRRSVEKLERMLYEMSLSEASGGRNVKTDVEEMIVDPAQSTS